MFEIDYIISLKTELPSHSLVLNSSISEPLGACIPQVLNSKTAAVLYGLDGTAHLRSSVLSFALCSPVPVCSSRVISRLLMSSPVPAFL